MLPFDRIITFGFYLLALLVPLIFYPFTSEVFEFNKMVFVYFITIVIASAWIGKTIVSKKIIFKKTILDIPLLIFLSSQVLSTLLSIDFRTSLLGYYSRFNGGLVSTICYSILYWAAVSNLDRKKVLNFIRFLLVSSILVCFYGILEHFGKSISCVFVTGKLDVSCWVQDVQNRVFATIGQPNWLAAWLVALFPLTWVSEIFDVKLIILKKNPRLVSLISGIFSSILFITVLYTKSRSGLLGLIAAFTIFWVIAILKFKKQIIKPFLINTTLIVTISLIIGTPWTPSIQKLTSFEKKSPIEETGPALETGGTESGEIRKIVWKGAFDLWKHYPLFGTGVETFAFSYYETRPLEHNLVSEWDYLYNKAHNEYLNYAATTGSIGLISLVVLLGFSLASIINFKINKAKISFNPDLVSLALASGFSSILISNFFGFSVVPVSLLLFLYPAFSNVEKELHTEDHTFNGLNNIQKLTLVVLLLFVLGIIVNIYNYWKADFLYNKGKAYNSANQYLEARKYLAQASKLEPSEAIYLNEQAKSVGNAAILLEESGKTEEAKQALAIYLNEANAAMRLSPRNLNIKRDVANMFSKLSSIDQNTLISANRLLDEMSKLAPTDPKIKFNLAVSYIHIGQNQTAEDLLKKIIEEKPNYKEARFTYAAILADKKQKEEALYQLNYILEKIDPKDDTIRDFIKDIELM